MHIWHISSPPFIEVLALRLNVCMCVCVQVLAKNLLLVKLGLLTLPAETLADTDTETDAASSAGMHPLRVTLPSSVSREGTLTCRGVWRGGAG